jgi:hypothetical protein
MNRYDIIASKGEDIKTFPANGYSLVETFTLHRGAREAMGKLNRETYFCEVMELHHNPTYLPSLVQLIYYFNTRVPYIYEPTYLKTISKVADKHVNLLVAYFEKQGLCTLLRRVYKLQAEALENQKRRGGKETRRRMLSYAKKRLPETKQGKEEDSLLKRSKRHNKTQL